MSLLGPAQTREVRMASYLSSFHKIILFYSNVSACTGLGWLATENLHLPLYVKIARRNTAQLILCASLIYLPSEMNGPTPRLCIYFGSVDGELTVGPMFIIINVKCIKICEAKMNRQFYF